MNILINNTGLLEKMSPITLDEMQRVRLMNRVDDKFVAPASFLRLLLEDIAPYFRVQANNGKRAALYQTQYLDTPSFDMFVVHHNGKLNRQKVRIRSYVESNSSFLEIKNKNNRGQTGKMRIPIPFPSVRSVADLGDDAIRFLDEQTVFDISSLTPSLSNRFDRITLVNNEGTERVTIDLNLSFLNHHTGNGMLMDNLMIIEMKQAGRQPSRFRDALRRQRIKPHPFSKYCMGSVLTNPCLKYNRFKNKWIFINKIIHLTDDSN
ncbi:MAG: polyphosphate polymerase domain-containing protein [Bacteroidales bacterium]|jgi:hypothetical protein|nr:polyphosphate polymerase domain-containing protein [Bacteroidales bacterium]